MISQISLEKRFSKESQNENSKANDPQKKIQNFISCLTGIQLKNYLWAYPSELDYLCKHYKICSEDTYMDFLMHYRHSDIKNDPFLILIVLLPFYRETQLIQRKKEVYYHDPSQIKPYRDRYVYARLICAYREIMFLSVYENTDTLKSMCVRSEIIRNALTERMRRIYNFYGKDYNLATYFLNLGMYLADKTDGYSLDPEAIDIVETLLLFIPRWCFKETFRKER